MPDGQPIRWRFCLSNPRCSAARRFSALLERISHQFIGLQLPLADRRIEAVAVVLATAWRGLADKSDPGVLALQLAGNVCELTVLWSAWQAEYDALAKKAERLERDQNRSRLMN